MTPTSPESQRLNDLEEELDRSRLHHDSWTLAIFVVAAIALFASVIGVGLGLRAIDESQVNVKGISGDAGRGVGAGSRETLEVELGDLFVEPGTVEISAGTELVVNVRNSGAMVHDLKLDGATGTGMLQPGESEQVSLGVIEETAPAWCTVPGHEAAGMVLEIVVSGTTNTTGPGPGTEGTGGASLDFSAEPGPDFRPYDPALVPAPGGREHQLVLRATEKVMEVAPGVTQELWTFNDQFPGPVLRGRVGDIFTITLVNEGKLGHSIDLHASKVAWNDEMRTIASGESLVYQFEAKHAGVFMYHCGTAPALHHIGNGMHGAIVIDPPDLAAVDHEYVLVQSELYLGADGTPGDLTKMQEERHDAVVFNGYVNQYLHRPIRVETGQRVRVWVLDAGPSENAAFHIVGTIFDTVFKEGAYQLRPDESRGGAQALDLQPSQGGFVEFTFDEPGLYPVVTHKFANVGKGALGLFQAGDVPAVGGAH